MSSHTNGIHKSLFNLFIIAVIIHIHYKEALSSSKVLIHKPVVRRCQRDSVNCFIHVKKYSLHLICSDIRAYCTPILPVLLLRRLCSVRSV